MESNKVDASLADSVSGSYVPDNRLKPVMVAETFVSVAEAIVAKKQFWRSLRSNLHVGVLMFDGCGFGEALRISELFGSLKENVRTSIIAEKRGVIATCSGAIVMVDFSFLDAPELDLLIIPAGNPDERLATTKEYFQLLRQLALVTPHVLAISSGALALARTGLLDGLRASIDVTGYDRAFAQSPQVKWDTRSGGVIDGKYFTAADRSGGAVLINALVCRLFGPRSVDHAASLFHDL